ncbi:hypothetical protein V5799_021849 [Amblyomma americanum]|uniref:F-box domain-containing protein n=1 Tax=Amblyomma americanum TaxID=6943 RepID=A0AAQ4FNT3_AMBAM
MHFEELPAEVVLKIFSYLSQACLVIVANVSKSWKKLAFDPYLWTDVRIDSRMQSAQDVRDVLDRATMIRKLDVSGGTVHLSVVASASKQFSRLSHLAIEGRALSHPSMPDILRNCPSLTGITLCGENTLLPNEIRVLENLSSLKALRAHPLHIQDEGIRQISASCPKLQRLMFNSDRISRKDTWDCLHCLRYLTRLYITEISTAGLLHASKSCPNLESLSIWIIHNKNDVTAAQALQGFVKLKVLTVSGECGSGWFDAAFKTPRWLEHLDVPGLTMKRHHFKEIVKSCRDTLRHIGMNGRALGPDSLGMLSECRNLESITVFALSGLNLLLSNFCHFPKLTRVQLSVTGSMTHVIRQLTQIVDILDTSRHGGTRLVLTVYCSSQASQNAMVREVSLFKDFLALNTCLSHQHIQDIEQQCWRIKDTKLFWLPLGGEVMRTIKTSFPATSKTLKNLSIAIREH